MKKHRRKSNHRRLTVAALAVAALGVPSVAMACRGGADEGSPSRHAWTSASSAAPAAPATAGTLAAAPGAAAPASAAPASGDTALVVELVNKERSKAGCAPLTVNAKLTKTAEEHSKDMADHRHMSHTGSDGSDPGARIKNAGYNWSSYGENVAYGYATPASVMAGWMSSPGHKRNILDCSFKEIGVGVAQPGDYWTQDFATAQ
ncbi:MULTISPECIES: CAP domain-containing protein [unclassified Streptomyces]|uniref:CAP domain-containing protein n=1 Tax=unclassified Streptomyces TaxID=2593676 RepID=UPI00037D471D|nr:MULTISPECIES: CAP domain-containing protein [unclassified Streptomyces]MYT28562.1 CAP domain-containing protein [Streptomyces sp. SID8354]